VVAFVLIAGARIFGPSDFFSVPDQARTSSLTTDMLVHGRWILPQDCLGEPSFKPVLYNWCSAGFVRVLGAYELTHKLPGLLAALTVALTIAFASPRLLGVHRRTALIATMAWLTMPSTMKHLYFCRPDMLFGACLVVAWIVASGLLLDRSRRRFAVVVWLAFAAALLAKGPLAFILPLYVLVGAKVLTGRWRACLRTGIVWGLPMGVGLAAVWLALAWRIDPDHVATRMLGGEVGGRLSGGWINVLRIWEVPGWLLERSFPWVVFAAITVVMVCRGRVAHSRYAPSLLWLLMFAAMIALLPGRAGSYLIPALPALALVGAEAASKLRDRGVIAIAAAMMAVMLGWRFIDGPGVADGLGSDSRAFVRGARGFIDPDQTLFVQTGLNGIPALLGCNPVDELSEADWNRAAFVVAPISAGPILHGPRLVFVRTLGMPEGEPTAARLALYERGDREQVMPSDPEIAPSDRFVGSGGGNWRVERSSSGGIDLYLESAPANRFDIRAASGAIPGGASVTAFETSWRAVNVFCIGDNGRLQTVWKSPKMREWKSAHGPKDERGRLRSETISSGFAPINGMMGVAVVDSAGSVVVYEWRSGYKRWRTIRMELLDITLIERALQTGYASIGFVATNSVGERYWVGKLNAWSEWDVAPLPGE